MYVRLSRTQRALIGTRSREITRDPITRDHARSREITRGRRSPTRSHEIHTRSHEITRDHTRSHEITRNRRCPPPFSLAALADCSSGARGCCAPDAARSHLSMHLSSARPRHSAYCCACGCSFTYCCCHASAAAANAPAMAPAPARVPAPAARAPAVESCVECCRSRCRRRSSCSAHRCSRSRSDVIPSMPRHKCLAHAAPRWR